jgi:glycosyltransferase involved in cell wall biosynthesis
VDVKRFCQTRFAEQDKLNLKDSLNINYKSKVLLFVGRITQEKGIFELFEAIKHNIQHGHDIVLIVVGPFEQNNEHEVRSRAELLCGDRIRFVGFQAEPERYMSITDLLCLPSYREGFGTVVIEAAAMEIPTVGTNIYGLTDAVVNGETGILVEPQSCIQLAEAIGQLVSDDILRKKLGEQAKKRALSDFDSVKFNELIIQKYKQVLDDVGYKIQN